MSSVIWYSVVCVDVSYQDTPYGFDPIFLTVLGTRGIAHHPKTNLALLAAGEPQLRHVLFPRL